MSRLGVRGLARKVIAEAEPLLRFAANLEQDGPLKGDSCGILWLSRGRTRRIRDAITRLRDEIDATEIPR